ncbi:MAG TPA: alpha/beta hydrolase, partial [Mycobacterium sp.]|nr:alpha/beta hydrolase [Mycobacterium sp.]
PGRRYRPADLGAVTRTDWVEAVTGDIAASGLTDIALVAHSSGGYVIPGVAARLAAQPTVRLRCLVFVAATVPKEGDAPVDYLRDDLRVLAVDTRSVVEDSARGKTLGGLTEGEPPIETDLEIVENGPRMGLEAPGPLFETMSWAGFPTEVPRFYIRCLRDKVIAPELADQMVANMGGATVVDFDGGHTAFRTHPDELAAVIDRCIGEVSS